MYEIFSLNILWIVDNEFYLGLELSIFLEFHSKHAYELIYALLEDDDILHNSYNNNTYKK